MWTVVDSSQKFYRKDLIDELKMFGMSSRYHIDDFMRGRIIERSKKGENNRCCQREFDIAHSVVSRLWKSFKTTVMCSRRHGEVALEVRCPRKHIYRRISEKEQAHHSSAGGKSVSCCLRKADLPKKLLPDV
ncbi:hypothetical protein TNCV_520891 [Trichonephila clavipes]|nr:hypothetical protein TNCV_520891 [Trichonephila clavipes]